MSDLISKLQWRYAAKKLDASRAVPQEKVDRILEAIRLTASSSGLQPYEVIVVTNPELRAQIVPHAWNQAQITDCSHLLVFAAWDNYTAERINRMFDLVNDERGFKNEGWEAYRQKLLAAYVPRDAETNYQHAARQAYIGLGTALIAAAEEASTARRWKASIPTRSTKSSACARKGYVPCCCCHWAIARPKATGW